ncbi:Holliday junction resolvase RuvX [Chloroflexia bacterium SDU3-3]|nr:Holliday junction resolvase RuvX [Chloroflexia bacterium SDU3-3]
MTSEPGRIMALDIGRKRIGVALSDSLRMFSSPLTTVGGQPRHAAIGKIAALIRQNEATELVVGLPLTLSGEVGPQAEEINRFVAELAEQVHIPIHMFDERLTTAEAQRVMIEMGMKPEQRKAKIDEMAASIILRDYLSARHPPPRPSAYGDYDDDFA